jgi:hypothetical protein
MELFPFALLPTPGAPAPCPEPPGMAPAVLGDVIDWPCPDPAPIPVPVLAPLVPLEPLPPPLPLLLGLLLPVPIPELPVPMPPDIPPALPPAPPAPPAACARAAPPLPTTRQPANAIIRMLVHMFVPPIPLCRRAPRARRHAAPERVRGSGFQAAPGTGDEHSLIAR